MRIRYRAGRADEQVGQPSSRRTLDQQEHCGRHDCGGGEDDGRIKEDVHFQSDDSFEQPHDVYVEDVRREGEVTQEADEPCLRPGKATDGLLATQHGQYEQGARNSDDNKPNRLGVEVAGCRIEKKAIGGKGKDSNDQWHASDADEPGAFHDDADRHAIDELDDVRPTPEEVRGSR